MVEVITLDLVIIGLYLLFMLLVGVSLATYRKRPTVMVEVK